MSPRLQSVRTCGNRGSLLPFTSCFLVSPERPISRLPLGEDISLKQSGSCLDGCDTICHFQLSWARAEVEQDVLPFHPSLVVVVKHEGILEPPKVALVAEGVGSVRYHLNKLP